MKLTIPPIPYPRPPPARSPSPQVTATSRGTQVSDTEYTTPIIDFIRVSLRNWLITEPPFNIFDPLSTRTPLRTPQQLQRQNKPLLPRTTRRLPPLMPFPPTFQPIRTTTPYAFQPMTTTTILNNPNLLTITNTLPWTPITPQQLQDLTRPTQPQ